MIETIKLENPKWFQENDDNIANQTDEYFFDSKGNMFYHRIAQYWDGDLLAKDDWDEMYVNNALSDYTFKFYDDLSEVPFVKQTFKIQSLANQINNSDELRELICVLGAKFKNEKYYIIDEGSLSEYRSAFNSYNELNKSILKLRNAIKGGKQ